MSRSLFGSGVSVSSAIAGNNDADSASELHSTRFFQLDRQGGYLQSATWRIPAGRNHTVAITLHYLASIFPTRSTAAAAYADARASLWEAGLPMKIWGVNTPGFEVDEANGSVSLVTIILVRNVEDEITLRFPTGVDQKALKRSGWVLHQVWKAALKGAQRYFQSSHAGNEVVSPLPPIAVAPAGTGPVVESPSLLLIDSAVVPPQTRLDPVVVRASLPPRIVARGIQHPDLTPAGSLSRFTRTASVGGGSLYNTAALYSNPAAAALAWTSLLNANKGRSEMRPVTLTPSDFPGADAVQGWRLSGELIMAMRSQNTVILLAGSSRPTADMVAMAGKLLLSVPTWLHADGTHIASALNQPVRLAGLNWYGAEQNDFVVGGLSYRSYQAILQTTKALGYNTIRLPFSNQMVEQNPVVTSYVDANPELSGLHALDIMDRIINYAGALGMYVILDDHRSDAGWSSQETGMWYTKQYPDSAFDADWAAMARRYAGTTTVIGADLRNEPHSKVTWGDGNVNTDWRLAAQRAGNAALQENPHLLIIVEGIQYFGNAPSYWWGGNLMGVASAPIELRFGDGSSAHSRLVYSAHDYGPDNCGGGCPWFNSVTTYSTLSSVWDQYWGYITADETKPYAAPVWVGEFGTCNYRSTCGIDDTSGSQGQWFSSLVHYLRDKNLSWTYWSLNGSESSAGARVNGYLDWYGYYNRTFTSPYRWLDRLLRGIQGDTGTSDSTHPTGPR